MSAPEMNPAPLTCANCRRELTAAALFCPACGTPRVREGAADELIGKVLGERFLVQERMGQGKSGSIYRAEHVTLRRKVAIKVLHHELSRDDLAIERFRREATSVAEIDNEHIVEIHDFGRTPDGRLYLAMELLDGETLDAALARDRQMPVERVADVIIQVGEALVEAHAVGFVHRDLRPRNVFLAVRRGKANFVKLLDFGLSKLVESGGAAASTSLGMTFGDPRYMSPEQARGDAIDRRADIYSLGCIAYEMLTGEPPFVGGKVFDVLTRHVNERPAALGTRRPDVPAWFEAVVMRALAKAPDERFLTAQKLVEALRTGLATGALPADDAVPVATPTGGSGPSPGASDSRRGPTGTPAVGVPVVAPVVGGAEAAAEPTASERVSMPMVAPPAPAAPPVPAAAPPAPAARDAGAAGPAAATAVLAAAAPEDVDDEQGRVTVPRGKRRTGRPTDPPASAASAASELDGPVEGAVRPSDSMNLSGAWFAAGDGDALGDSQLRSLERARATVDPGDSLLDDGVVERSPTKKIFLVAGVAAVILVIAVLALGSGGGKDKDGSGRAQPAASQVGQAALAPADGASPAAAATGPGDAGAATGVAEGPAGTPAAGGSAAAPPTGDTAGSGPGSSARAVERGAGSGPGSSGGRRGGGGGSSTRTIDDPYPADPGPTSPGAVTDEAAKMAEFYAKAGEAALRSGDPGGAAGNFQKALAQNPRNVEAILGLGEVAMQQGLYTDAIRQLKRAVRLAPRSARVHTLLGESYLNSGQDALAEQSFKKALQLDPDSARARNGYLEAAQRLPPPSDDPF